MVGPHSLQLTLIQMHSKNTQGKAWRQTYFVDSKQIESYSKDVPKLFNSSAMTSTPLGDKLSKTIAEHEQEQLKIHKQEGVTFQKLRDIAQDVHGLRNVLKFYQQTNQYLVKVQNSSENILGKLEQFRGKMGTAYESLADDEEKINQQLQFLAKKIEGTGREDYPNSKEHRTNNTKQPTQKRIQSAATRPPKNEVINQQTDQPHLDQQILQTKKAIERTEKEMLGLGKYLGWPEQDHTDFKSIWNRCQTKNFFVIEQQMKKYFAFYTSEQIQEHMKKYKREQFLNEQKKQFLAQYKNLKQAKKIEDIRNLNLEKDKGDEIARREQAKRKAQKGQQRKKAQLQQWQEKKIRQRRQEEERRAVIEWEQKQKQEWLKRQKEERSRQLLGEWKEDQLVKKEKQVQRVRSARKQVPIDPQVQQRIRLREQMLVQKKLQLVNDRRRQQQMMRQKESRLKQQKFVKFSHVNNQLDKKTTAIREKQREKFDGKQRKDANTFGGQLMMTGVRATPNWMKAI